ncbi:heparinase [Falsiroseomonas bella]|uniref:Heparinase n=1 Tax=Falsiroseomonas bella TaxID=2184016 RepID=A0A317FJ50_9PROT|nr:heparinase II/III family protein [Falsiroseomonas bella]PWS38795.1 heparinase [Falsiroseomonas bella]
MFDQVTTSAGVDAQVEATLAPSPGADARWLAADAAWRLGLRPVACRAVDHVARRLGVARRRLRDRVVPKPPFLPPHAPPPPALPADVAARVLAAAAALPERPDWHGGFDPRAHALDLVLHRGAGARPVWEASRLAALPLLAQAARIAPEAGHLARAESLLRDWCRANPPFRGVAWACGQEAAFRALHLALALALLDADRDPPQGARDLLGLCAARIAATPLYALAQDNNHPISEAAGAFACALLRGEETRPAAARLARGVARLVAPDGGFAQVSAGYARVLLDTLSLVEWLRRRHGAPPFPAPLAERAAALARWLHGLVEPRTGATPPLGLEDGSALADLALRGPGDARGSVERAARLFCAASADAPDDPGCAWLGLPRPAATLERPTSWRASGTSGWRAAGSVALLRTGPLRFRPFQCDLLHLSLRDGAEWIIRDGGTGSYDPPEAWWWGALSGGAAHNAPVFDDAEPMPRAGRFLLARWPRITALPDGAAAQDSRGNRTERRIAVEGRVWTVRDVVSGPFRTVSWHWRLRPGPWALREDGVASPHACLRIQADAKVALDLILGWESPDYGRIRRVPVLRVSAAAPIRRVTTTIDLPAEGLADAAG